LNQEILDSVATQDCRAMINGITLADATEMHAHSLATELRGSRSRIHHEVFPTDQRQLRRDGSRVGYHVILVVIESP